MILLIFVLIYVASEQPREARLFILLQCCYETILLHFAVISLASEQPSGARLFFLHQFCCETILLFFVLISVVSKQIAEQSKAVALLASAVVAGRRGR